MYILLFFALILFINFIYNLWSYRQCDKHMKRFQKWLFVEDYERDLSLDKPAVKKLVKNAGVYGGLVPVTRPMGLGQVLNANINPIDQYPDRTVDIATAIQRHLANAKGVYKERMLLSIHPILWIEFILYLPSKIITYLGFKDGILNRVFNVIWWIVGVIVIPILINTYSEEIIEFVKSILGR